MGRYYSIMMRTHYFDKIIEVLEDYTASLDNYYEIEECVNLIHLIQEEIYKYKEKQQSAYKKKEFQEAGFLDLTTYIWSIIQNDKIQDFDSPTDLLNSFYIHYPIYQETDGEC